MVSTHVKHWVSEKKLNNIKIGSGVGTLLGCCLLTLHGWHKSSTWLRVVYRVTLPWQEEGDEKKKTKKRKDKKKKAAAETEPAAAEEKKPKNKQVRLLPIILLCRFQQISKSLPDQHLMMTSINENVEITPVFIVL